MAETLARRQATSKQNVTFLVLKGSTLKVSQSMMAPVSNWPFKLAVFLSSRPSNVISRQTLGSRDRHTITVAWCACHHEALKVDAHVEDTFQDISARKSSNGPSQ